MKRIIRKFIQSLGENKKYFVIYGIMAILLSIVTVAFSFIEAKTVFYWWLKHPMIIFLNAVPLFLIMVLLHGISGKYPIPIIITALGVLILSMVNKEKIVYRQDPLFLADLSLWKEAVNIILQGSFSTKILWIGALILGGGIFLIVKTSWGRYRMGKGNRVLLILTTSLLFFLSLELFYREGSFVEAYVPPQLEEEVNISQTFRDQGIIYSLLRYRDVNNIQKPHPFLEHQVKEYEKNFQREDLSSKPDVIFIMGEAWSDISENPHLTFQEGQDPFDVIRPILAESIGTGHIIAPTFGGGTANTEYDAMTGNATLFLSESRFTSYHATRHDIESIARILGRQGYQTYALHPGQPWFYNREKVYEYMGFDNSEFAPDFENPEIKGKFISEDETTRHFIRQLEEMGNKQDPYMALLVTIQNHSPFNFEKYDEEFDTFTSDVPLTEDSKEMLESFFVGIRDMNRNIKILTDYLRERKRPTVVIYWGDHQPSLGEDFKAFRELGYRVGSGVWENLLDVYQTPYFVWGNEAFREKYPPIEMPPLVNANYLSTLALETFDGTRIDPFVYFSQNMMEVLPVFHRYFYISGDQPEEFKPLNIQGKAREYFDLYRSWQYMRAK